MSRPATLAAFLLSVSCAIAATSTCVFAEDAAPAAALTIVHQAKALVEDGRQDDAISILDDAIQQHKNAGILYLTRGLLHQAANRDRNAIDDFSRAVELKFLPALAHTSRGLSRLTLGDQKGALVDLNLAIQIDPSRATAYFLRGRVLYENERLPPALKDLDNAIRLDPTAEAFVARALCHLRAGDYTAACGDATRAAELDPCDSAPIYIRMSAHLERGDSEAAAADFELAKTLDATVTR